MLDLMDIECECGIMIKVNMVWIDYKVNDGEDYIFNLIDISGYVDFVYEVSCFMCVVEGFLLVVDVF